MSLFNNGSTALSPWKNIDKIALRFLVIYFIIQAVPLDWKFYRQLFTIDWSDLSFYDLFQLTRYYPLFFGIEGFGNWFIVALLALVGTGIWTVRYSANNTNYDQLYYWLRVLLRYRLALGIIAYGLIKFFPLQMPYPSLSNLHTNYGDFYGWKIYFHTLGVAQGYEVFLGAVEIASGVLLLFRRTTTFGAGLILGFTGNVFAANFFYDAGEQVYSAYLFIIAGVLFLYDAPRLYRLLIQKKYTAANAFKPVFATNTLRKARGILKTGAVVFIVLLAFATYTNFTKAPYKIPSTPGLTGAYGFYNVREFRFNNQLIPYSTTDSNRWQNVIFEKWATSSIKIARPVTIDNSTGDTYHKADIDRNFESAGVGGRHYYAYEADTVQHSLLFRNKNPHHAGELYKLHYNFLNDSTIVLQGVNEKNDSIYAVLDRINRKYMLFEGRRKRVKL